MATLKELIDRHGGVPGLKVQFLGWDSSEYFEIVDIRRAFAIGWDNRGESWNENINEDNWELYQPPAKAKRKVMMYPALCKLNKEIYIPDGLYASEEDARTDLDTFIRLLTDRGVEVEVDD